MTTPRIAIATTTALLCLGLVAARPAGAAPLLSVSYDVTGGTFGHTGSPITGGRVLYTLPAGGLSTPTYCGGCGSLYVKLTGPTTTQVFSSIRVTFASIYPDTLTAIAKPASAAERGCEIPRRTVCIIPGRIRSARLSQSP